MFELLIVILIVLLVLSFVLPATGHPFPGGSLVSLVLIILVVLLIVGLFGGVLD